MDWFLWIALHVIFAMAILFTIGVLCVTIPAVTIEIVGQLYILCVGHGTTHRTLEEIKNNKCGVKKKKTVLRFIGPQHPDVTSV